MRLPRLLPFAFCLLGHLPGAPSAADTFWENLRALCGQAYEGRVVEGTAPGDAAFRSQRLVMHVAACGENEIRIPFHVGENRSRTWVITRTATGLRLKHDHRHADGTEDAVTQYGGNTAGPGTTDRQEFPADAFTAQLLPAARTNIWTLTLEPGKTFGYGLRREAEDRRFRVEFDLTRPVPPPPPPWSTTVRYEANWDSLDRRPTPAWFLDAKFGVFIHWGVYSVPAWGEVGEYSEWYWQRIRSKDPKHAAWRKFHESNYGAGFDYMDFAPRFTAELFDARQWADLFVRAGIKYVVPTSKHHDGFALWPSAEASRTWGRPWNAAEVGPRRDLLGELADATRARGLKFGFYYSLYEWFNPLWLADRDRYIREHLTPQFQDVVKRYSPAIVFSDGEWDLPSADWRSPELLAWLFNESPARADVVINDRWGKDTRHRHGGYFTTEYAAGLQDDSHPWEESRGMAHSYGYNRAERIDDYKSGRELILVLVDLVSRGGNLLLDIGPAADGTIPPLMEQRLLEIGDWLKVNGEAIYGSRFAGRSAQWTAGERPRQDFGEYRVKYDLLAQVGQAPRDGLAVKQAFFTRRPDALYAITPGWPGERLVLRGLRVPADAKVTMLGVPGELAATVAGDTLQITTPRLDPESAPCRHAFTFKITGAELLPGS